MEMVEASSILSVAGGFLKRLGYAYTCNPYLGCNFGCAYCYAAFLPQNKEPLDQWGKWLKAKENAVELARKQASLVKGKAVYLSSVTDPYLPAEKSLRLTRGIFEALLPYQPRLVVQTRSALFLEDLDLLLKFDKLQVNVSVTTDSVRVWSAFEPKSPTLDSRWLALRHAKAKGARLGFCCTPTLPLADPALFAREVAALNPAVVVTQEFHQARGGWGADTGPKAQALLDEYKWGRKEYDYFRELLSREMPGRQIFDGEPGFAPPE